MTLSENLDEFKLRFKYKNAFIRVLCFFVQGVVCPYGVALKRSYTRYLNSIFAAGIPASSIKRNAYIIKGLCVISEENHKNDLTGSLKVLEYLCAWEGML